MTTPAAIDGHQHFWDPARVPLPWLRPELKMLDRAFEPADLEPLMADAGVCRTILVQSAGVDEDTGLMLEHARRHDWIAAVVAWLPLHSPSRTRTRLDDLAGEAKLRGVRHLLHEEQDPHWIMRPSVLESLALVESRGLVLEVPAVFPQHLSDVPALARRFPSLKIVIDHLGKPPIGRDGFDEWVRQLQAAAEEPNVSAKISGLNTATTRRDWSADDLVTSVRTAFDAFGADRLLCGSDWPIALLNGTYPRVWREIRRVLDIVAPGYEDRLLAGTAARLYGLTEHLLGGDTRRGDRPARADRPATKAS